MEGTSSNGQRRQKRKCRSVYHMTIFWNYQEQNMFEFATFSCNFILLEVMFFKKKQPKIVHVKQMVKITT